MSDRIFADNLRIACRVGITPEERREPQEVLVDVSLTVDLARAGKSDDMKDTINYKDIIQRVSQAVSDREFNLLESLAEGVARALLETFSVQTVVVRVRKAKYSSEPSVGIEVERDTKTWSSPS